MILKVVAIESIEPMALVSLLFNDSNQISCRKSLPSEPPDAIARRRIANGESITFDSGQNTNDLLGPELHASYTLTENDSRDCVQKPAEAQQQKQKDHAQQQFPPVFRSDTQQRYAEQLQNVVFPGTLDRGVQGSILPPVMSTTEPVT